MATKVTFKIKRTPSVYNPAKVMTFVFSNDDSEDGDLLDAAREFVSMLSDGSEFTVKVKNS